MIVRARAVLFDCDGVLVDSDDAVVEAWTRWARERGLVPDEVLAVVHGRRSADTVTALVPEAERAAALALIDRYEVERAGAVRALPGAAALLAAAPAGRWAVVTSGRRDLAVARLEAAGLPVPDVLVTADDVEHGKPDPEGYLAAAAALGVSAADGLVVEDSPDGIRAGRAAGAAVVGVGERAAAERPDVHVADLRQARWHDDGLEISAAP